MRSFVPRLVSLAFLTVALAAGCSSQWTSVKTKNFTLYTDSEFLYRDTLRLLEQGYSGLKARYFSAADVGRIEVLFLDDVPFQDLFGSFRTGAAVAKVPSSNGIGKEGLLVLRPNLIGAGSERASESQGSSTIVADTRAGRSSDRDDMSRRTNEYFDLNQSAAGTAAVEMLTHLFIQRSMANAPLWFHEGFASYARNMQYREGDGQKAACFGVVPGAAQKESIIPSMADFWNANFDKYDEDYRDWLPFTGRLLFDYIVHGESGRHRDKLGPFVVKVYDGTSGGEALKAAFGWSDEDAYERIKNHRQMVEQEGRQKISPRGICPLPLQVSDDIAPDTSEPQRSPVDDAVIKTLIASLERLPRRNGFPPYFPLEVCEAAERGKK